MDNANKADNNLIVPGWMLGEDNDINIKHVSETGFIRRTIAAALNFMQNDMLAERFASKKGMLQALDPRVKLITIIILMVLTGWAKGFAAMVFLFLTAFMMVKYSKLSIFAYFKRVWLVLPVMAFILSLPAATSLIIQGKPFIYIWQGFNTGLAFIPSDLYFSLEGLMVILRMSIRMGVSLSLGYALAMTTRWSDITGGLWLLKVPNTAVALLDMTYRYIFVLVRVSVEMYEARSLRTVGRIRNRENRRFISGTIALLFIKTHLLSEEVYDAMVSRGYSGKMVSFARPGITRNDFVWISNIAIVVIIIVIGEFVIA